MGRTEIPDLSGLQGEPWLVGTVFFQLERNGAFSKADAEVRSKENLTPPTLSERLINPTLGPKGVGRSNGQTLPGVPVPRLAWEFLTRQARPRLRIEFELLNDEAQSGGVG